ncbi:MAG: hypothetical protein JRN20_13960 [Nitrososphaerota archaeon]|nr:hypothetical protein [Nitrososphaerota archaeon]MDG6922723.1 hypothetical protein [Nitrososphaerota archaeon]
MLRREKAISLGLAALVVIVLILIVGFGAFLANDLYSTKVTTSTQTVTLPGTPETQTVTETANPTSEGSLVTMTEHVNTFVVYIITHVIITNSSTTYTCWINPTLTLTRSTTASFAPANNITGTFSATVVTISSNTTTTSTLTVSQPYPLTTSITTQNGSTQTVTVCSAETG